MGKDKDITGIRRIVERLIRVLDSCRWPFAFLARRRFEQIIPLGYNCETAFRFYRKWGFLDSSLFAWTSLSRIERLVDAIGNLSAIGTGEMVFSPITLMWTCRNSDICFHGRLKPSMSHSQGEIDADQEDLRGRIRHLKEKFISYATNGKSTLFIYKPRPSDIERPEFNDNLDALERALARIGSRNWTLLIVCERKSLTTMRPGVNRIFRTVRRYSPADDVTNRRKGDPAGWNLVFTEFAPSQIRPKAHAFKFE